MGFKRGMIVGFGIGYVLGAKAGKERYEQIRQAWGKVMGNPQVQAFEEKAKDIAAVGAKKSLHTVQEGVEKTTGAIKERLNKDDGQAAEPTTTPPEQAEEFIPPSAATP